jgi:hypothetical protein
MAHEIGHMLGLEHDPSPRALMHWQGGELTTDGEIPPEDRAAYRAR